MSFNSLAGSFQPLSTFAAPPAIREPTVDYPPGQTAAQLTTLGFTGVSVTTSGATIQGATARKTLYLANPSDNLVPITVGNISAGAASGGIAVVLPTPPVTPLTQTFTPTSNGFAIPPGGILGFGAGFNDPVYAVAASTATLYYIQT